jgi:hypothetical protein
VKESGFTIQSLFVIYFAKASPEGEPETDETAAGDSGDPDGPPPFSDPSAAAGDKAMTAPLSAHAFEADTVPVHDALHLTGGGVLARIVLSGQVYSLRITRAGKLILTK